MQTAPDIRAFHVVIEAPAATVFDTVRDLRNLPKWSVHFCKAIRFEGPDAWVTSPNGEVYFRINGDRRTGLLDWWSGPSKAQVTRWPTRVFELADGRSVYQITAVLSEAEAQLPVEQLIGDELSALKRLVEGVAPIAEVPG